MTPTQVNTDILSGLTVALALVPEAIAFALVAHVRRVVDHSAIEAIDAPAGRYQQEGKVLHLRHLSADCLELLGRAKPMVEVNAYDDALPHRRRPPRLM